jgi:hypothetical protein
MPPRSRSDGSPVSVARWRCNNDSSSSTSSVETSKQPLSKSLKFADANEVFHVDHLDEIPDHEVAATWYNAQEYRDITSSYQLTIILMETGEELSNEHTRRGLEYRTEDGAWARYKNKQDAYNAVLDEQDRQWKADRVSKQRRTDENIRTIYLEHSASCAHAAHLRAVEDEKIARKILRSIMPSKKRDGPPKRAVGRSKSEDGTKKPISKRAVGRSKSEGGSKEPISKRAVRRSSSEAGSEEPISKRALRRSSSESGSKEPISKRAVRRSSSEGGSEEPISRRSSVAITNMLIINEQRKRSKTAPRRLTIV